MYTVIGLGNPGRKYEDTRHNIGFAVIDHTAGYMQSPFKAGKGDYYFAESRTGTTKIMLVKPTTYMNRSGLAVRQIIEYFRLAVSDMLIVCDDYNLPLGTFRFRQSGSDGGHHGLESIIYELETDDIARLRIGIGYPSKEPADYVLTRFDKRESEQINQLLPLATEAILTWIDKGIGYTMNKYNRSFLSTSEVNENDT